jgi:hypothetical protein
MQQQPAREVMRQAKAMPRRSYSFARAGSLWMPRTKRIECIGGVAGGGFAARGMVTGNNRPTNWPSGSTLAAWYHWRYERTYSSQLSAAGATPPTVTHSGVVPINCGLKLDIPTGGARGTATFRYSLRNGDGTDWSAEIPTAATYVVPGTSIQLQFSNVGTYATNNVYEIAVSSWRDLLGGGHHLALVDSVHECPSPTVTPYGTGIGFDGIGDVLQCSTSLAATLVGGTDNNFTAMMVVRVNSVSPSSGLGTLLHCGNSSNNRLVHLGFTNTPTWRVTKTDDAPSSVNVSGGTPTVGIHIVTFVHTGTTTQIFVEGTSVVGPTAQDLGALTGINNVTIGKSFLSGAKGNPGAFTAFEYALWTTDLSAADRAENEGLMRAPYGF